MFELNPGLAIWTTVVFVIFAFLLAKFGWKPILQALNEREQKIRGSLEQAEKARQETAELMKQNEKNRAAADEEYQRIVREAKALAEKMKDEIVERGRSEAQRHLDHAKDELRREVDAAKQQLRGEVADLAIQAAGKILDESLDSKKHQKLVETFLKQLPEN